MHIQTRKQQLQFSGMNTFFALAMTFLLRIEQNGLGRATLNAAKLIKEMLRGYVQRSRSGLRVVPLQDLC